MTQKIKTVILLLSTLLIMSGCDNTKNQELIASYSLDDNRNEYPINTDIEISYENYKIQTEDIYKHIKLYDSNNKEVRIDILKSIENNSTDVLTIKYDKLNSHSQYTLKVEDLILIADGSKNRKITKTIPFNTEKIETQSIEELQNIINDKNNDLNTLTTYKNQTENQIIELNNSIENLIATKTDLENQVNTNNNDISNLDNQIETLKIDKQTLENYNTDLDNQITNLKDEKTDLENQIMNKEITITDLQNQIDTLTEVLTYNDMTNLLNVETSVITSNLQQHIVLVFKENVNAYSFYSNVKITDSLNNELTYTLNVESNTVDININSLKENETYTIFIDNLIKYDGTNGAYKITYNTTIDTNHLNIYFTI